MGEVIYHEFTAPNGAVFKCRTVNRKGDPWFVGADVCLIVSEYRLPNGKPNTSSAVRGLGPDEKGSEKITTPGGIQSVIVISESGLYKLILRAHPSNTLVKPFQDWVTKVVLPSIRKTGGYLLNEEARQEAHADNRQTMPLPATFAEALRAHAETLLKLAETTEEKERLSKEIERLQPQAAISQRHFARMDHMKLSRFSRTLDGVNSNKTKSDLERLGYLHVTGGTYRVYSQYRGTLFLEKRDEVYGNLDIYPTEAGRAAIVKHYEAGDLTMRIGFSKAP